MKRAHFKKSPFLMYVENLEMNNSLKWAVQGDRSRCDQNSDTASDRRPITRSVFMVEILIIPESHLRLCSATIGTDHG